MSKGHENQRTINSINHEQTITTIRNEQQMKYEKLGAYHYSSIGKRNKRVLL